METVAYRPLPIDQFKVRYEYGPDSGQHPDAPAGQTIELTLPPSTIYPGSSRRVWVHVPAGHDPSVPAAFVVFQDGWWNLDPDGEVRGGIVLDNLVHSRVLPPTIGVFVDPGVFTDVRDLDARKNRNAEYDAFDDRYVRFLLQEVLPLVEHRWRLSNDPADRAVCGGSSGGNPYPELIPTMPAKPLRVFLQAGHRDLNWNEPDRNWLANNLRVVAALAEASYDFRLVLGDGGHSPNHGGVLLPDALRWVFRV